MFRSEAEQLSSVVPFLLAGLDCGEKCVYILDSSSREDIVDALMAARDIQAHLESGQLSFMTSDETYLKGGRFDVGRMLNLVRDNEAKSVSEGYRGLRATGEMTWSCTGAPGADLLAEYEARLNGLYPESDASMLCQYYEPSFGHDVLLDVLRTHPMLVMHGELCSNPYYVPLDEFLSIKGGHVPRETYERTSHDILRRVHLSIIHRLEMRDFRRTRRRLSVLESAGLDEIGSLVDVVKFYNELAMDSCPDAAVRDYLGEIGKRCSAIHKRISFAKAFQLVGETEIGWRSLEEDVERAVAGVDACDVSLSIERKGIEVLADDMFERAIRSVLENIPDMDVGSREVLVRCRESEACLVLSVEHEGKGVPEGAKSQLFCCGSRYGNSDGYGLFLAKEILACAGISIRECGIPGRSTRFEISLPEGRYRLQPPIL
ncbi:MAG: MEDS domain-containing protein [Methanobacteriota archaeon]|nr:MAG: MEDS domain-containing protein [Euryarchaeota archaeon]